LLVSSVLPIATIMILFGFVAFGAFSSTDIKGYIPYLMVGGFACIGLCVILIKTLKGTEPTR
jgi:hypothetical protein